MLPKSEITIIIECAECGTLNKSYYKIADTKYRLLPIHIYIG